jgi:hypothetical protein
MAVSIGAARLLLLYALAKKNLVYFIFMAVSIRTASILYGKKGMAVSIKDSSTIAICFSNQIMHLILIAVSIRTASAA